MGQAGRYAGCMGAGRLHRGRMLRGRQAGRKEDCTGAGRQAAWLQAGCLGAGWHAEAKKTNMPTEHKQEGIL
jgi:hypothetical protein